MKERKLKLRVKARRKFELVLVRDFKLLEGFRVHPWFTDGSEGEIDLEPYLWGPVFEPIRRNPDQFRAVRLEGGTLACGDEADIAPETLYAEARRPTHRVPAERAN